MSKLLAGFKALKYLNSNTFSPGHLRNRWALVRALGVGKSSLPGVPMVIQLEVTNRCNFNCVMCPRPHMTRPLGHMSWETFIAAVDQVRGRAEFAILHNMGEPLLQPRLAEMIRYCRNSGLRTAVSTNAEFLTEKRGLELIESGLDVILFSMEGVEPETMKRLRPGSDFGKSMENFRRFGRQKGPRPPQAIVQMIVLPETQSQVVDFRRQWAGEPNLITALKPFTVWKGDRTEINSLGGRDDVSAWEHNICDRPWLWATVLWDGTVVPCCRDYDASVALGNVLDRPLRELINGPEFQEFRSLHARGRSLCELCRHCDYPSQTVHTPWGRVAYTLFDQYTLYRLMYDLTRSAMAPE